MKKLSEFLSENFQFLVVEFSIYLNVASVSRQAIRLRECASSSGPFKIFAHVPFYHGSVIRVVLQS